MGVQPRWRALESIGGQRIRVRRTFLTFLNLATACNWPEPDDPPIHDDQSISPLRFLYVRVCVCVHLLCLTRSESISALPCPARPQFAASRRALLIVSVFNNSRPIGLHE